MKACGRGLFSVRSPVAEEPGGIVVILQQGEFHMMEAVRLLLTMGSAGSFHFFIGEDPEGDVSAGLFQGFRGLAADGHRNGFIMLRLGDIQRDAGQSGTERLISVSPE